MKDLDNQRAWMPFSIVDIEKKHDINIVAKKDAQRGLPTNEGLSNCENEVIIEGSNYISNLNKKANEHFNEEEIKVEKLSDKVKGDSYQVLLETIKNDNDNSNKKYVLGKEYDQEEKDEAKSKLKNFKKEHDRLDDAEPYTNQTLGITIVLILGLLIFEVIINGKILGDSMSGGQSAGTMMSLAVAFLNVGVSSVMGYFLAKKTNLIVEKEASLAKNILIVYGLIIFYLNWAFAAYRGLGVKLIAKEEGLAQEAEQLGLQAKEIPLSEWNNVLTEALTPWRVMLQEGGFGFPEFALLFMGVSFAGLAMLKTYYFDDVYPNYGKMVRKYLKPKENLRKKKEEKLQHEISLFDSYASKIEEIRENEEKNISEWSSHIQNYQSKLTLYKREIINCIKGVNHILEEYRNKNKYHRKDGDQVPKHFNEKYKPDPDDYNSQIIFRDSIHIYMNDADRVIKKDEFFVTVRNDYESAIKKLKIIKVNIVEESKNL